jgi:hypothetical protein
MAKRTRWIVRNEILVSTKGEVSDELWTELLINSKSFLEFRDNWDSADIHNNEKWRVIFMGRMRRVASRKGDWKSIVEKSKKFSPEWSEGIWRIYKNAVAGGSVRSRWTELGQILPKGHPLRKEVKKNINRVNEEKKEGV